MICIRVDEVFKTKYTTHAQEKEVIDLRVLDNEHAVHEFIQKPLALLVVKTNSCSVCRGIENRLTEQVSVIKNIPTAMVYVDELEIVRGNLMVFSVPATIVFTNGKEVFRSVRFIDMAKLNQTLEGYYETMNAQ